MAGTGNTSVRSYTLYSTAAVTADFIGTEILFVDDMDNTPFLSTGIMFINDGTGDYEFSFDGKSVHGRVNANDVLTFDFMKHRKVYLRGIAAAIPTFRMWAW